jgi:uncharacterized membrane protein YedE/YeeE
MPYISPNFTTDSAIDALFGGMIVSLAVILLVYLRGSIAGMSGLLHGLLIADNEGALINWRCE